MRRIWLLLVLLILLPLPVACGRGSDEPRLTMDVPTRLPTYTPEPATPTPAPTLASQATGQGEGALESAVEQAAAAMAVLAATPVTDSMVITTTGTAAAANAITNSQAITAATVLTDAVTSAAEITATASLTDALRVTATEPVTVSTALSAPASISTTETLTSVVAVQPATAITPSAVLTPTVTATAAFTSAMPFLPTRHVPSPDWRDQIIYFVMTDRFADGDPSNNDQGYGEFDPSDRRKYSGGDFAGIIEQLNYIQGLGATALWITPPVANQWWNPEVEYGGYHGYWAEDFSTVDAHLGSLADYQALARALHGRGMYLIQDVVTNHVGDYFTYTDEGGQNLHDPLDPTQNYRPIAGSVPVSAPSQPPFDQNDPTDPAHLDADIYHWTPEIQNQENIEERLTYQLADLDDLNTTNPFVRDALRASYGQWIREVGVDAFRIDTIKHVEHDFWNDFMHGTDPAAPGMHAVAAETGRDDFLAFGEAFYGSAPFDDSGEEIIATYLGSETRPELSSVIHFPLHFTIGRVFAEGAPTAQMGYRLQAAQEIFPDPTLLPTFIDNHDVPRFLAGGTTAGLKQALTFLMTSPGIPVIYYGTEQGFSEARSAMFAEGWGSGGSDHFDEESELYNVIQELSSLRRNHPLFARGDLTVLQTDSSGPGVLAYARDYASERALVLFNTADKPVLMVDLATGLPGGSTLTPLLAADDQEALVVPDGGRMSMELEPRAAFVWLVGAPDESAAMPESAPLEFTIITPLADMVFTDTLAISGTVSAATVPLKLVVNDDLARAIEVVSGDAGDWSVAAPLTGVAPGLQENTLHIWAPEQAQLSAPISFTSDLKITESSVTVYDLIGDTVGPDERYVLPTDSTFGQQLDIVETTVRAAGPELEVALTMTEITDEWDPANGFDHVLFHVFIDVPEQTGGATDLPRLNASSPAGFEWDYLAMVEGWNNRLYGATGASPDAYGVPVTPVADVETDSEAGVVTLRFAGEALGNPASLAGARVYVTTWDWNGVDGEYRRLTETPQQWTFGGGDGAVDPLILDDTEIIEVPAEGDLVANEPPGVYEPAGGITPMVDVTLAVTVPATTPADARLFVTGPWVNWAPAAEQYELLVDDAGVYRLTLPVEEGERLEFRITRGSFANAEQVDRSNRTANRVIDVPVGESELTAPIAVQSWWDDE